MGRQRMCLISVAVVLVVGVATIVALPVGTAITYQGRLTDEGSPADGQYDLQFTLYDSLGFDISGPLVKNDEPVVNGLFTIELDFGSVFTGDAVTLEIGVRPGASTSDFMILSPRQAVRATPYALYALSSAGGSGSPWTVVGNEIHYSNGNVGVGVAD